jgi:hypothetical protein
MWIAFLLSFIIFIFETGLFCVAQDGLEFAM